MKKFLLNSLKTNLIIFLIVFSVITALTPLAQASFYNFQCGDLTQVEFYDSIDSSWYRGLSFIPKGPAVLRFQSRGGLIENEEIVMNRIRILANQVLLKSGVKLKIVLANNCASACTILTAGLNMLAGSGQLDLVVDSGLQLGFHAGFKPETQTVFPASQLAIYYTKYGVSNQWFFQNQATFSTRDLKWVSANDPWLAGSNILSHAAFVSGEASDFPIPANASCTPGPVE